MKRVLLIAFQYPPMTGSSGIQRALRFSQYLPDNGWKPIVLTAHPRAYERTSDDQLGDIPDSVLVRRAFAFDAARHLAVRGRYLSCMADPDRWRSWHWFGVREGMRIIREFEPDVLWSTFPIPTAHRIGLDLHRRTGLPWIADFRDVMTEEGYPLDPRLARSWKRLEAQFIEACEVAVFTTPGAAQMYAQRYPGKPGDRFRIIENGYDEDVFAGVEVDASPVNASERAGPIRILHSGVVYPSERDPAKLFAAMTSLKAAGKIDARTFRIVFRASGHDAHLLQLAQGAGVEDMIEFGGPLPYRQALREMLDADALLVLQADNCSRQIPAKLYEYMRARRPILGLATGDTAHALRCAGIDTIAPLESEMEIAALLPRLLALVRASGAPRAGELVVRSHSRRARSEELANLLDSVSS